MSVFIREATQDEALSVSELMNSAFVADAWFKKEEFHDRFDSEGKEIRDYIGGANKCILIAISKDDNSVVGAVQLDWNKESKVGHWGALAVPSQHGGKGVGSKLVLACLERLKEYGMASVEILVVSTNNARLVEWYRRFGLSVVGDSFPFVAPHIVLDEHQGKIMMVKMVSLFS